MTLKSRRRHRASAAVAVACASALALMGGASVQAEPRAAVDRESTAIGDGGAVASLDPYATQAGIDILRRGGNAIDAAVATSAMLGLTRPYDGSIGGGGFMVVYSADAGEVTTIDGREEAGAEVEPDHFLDPETGEPLPFTERRVSGLSVGVPGLVRGWETALDKHGSMSLDRVLRPAIRQAREGFVVDAEYQRRTEDNLEMLQTFTSSRKTFLTTDAGAPQEGSVFRNPELADTYQLLGNRGPDAFYEGPLAESIAAAVTEPPVVPNSDREVRAGKMTPDDLTDYAAVERAPTMTSYRGLEIYGMGPPSSGGTTVAEALNILDDYDLGALSRDEAWHLMIEASALSFADRNAYLGDSDYVAVPVEGLLSKEFAHERRRIVGPEAAPKPVTEGDPWAFQEGSGDAAPAMTAQTDGSTTHLTTADRYGNLVSFTFTIESIGGSGIAVPGGGFLLNNELTDFDPEPDHPANAPDGGKRPRSSMSPTIVLDDGTPVTAFGSPGGPRIITTVYQVLVNQVDFGMTLPAAIAAPRLSNLNDSETAAERGIVDSPAAGALRERGHDLAETSTLGNVTGVAFLADGRLQAAAEPTRHGGGSAMVVQPSP